MELKINKEIYDKLESTGLENKDEAVLYLLSVYFNLNVDGVLDAEMIRKVNLARIVNTDLVSTNNVIMWFKPLLVEVSNGSKDNFEWVLNEYREMWDGLKVGSMGDAHSCVSKMKEFFVNHPDVRKDEVIAASKLYLSPFKQGSENPRYVTQADFFISKQDVNKVKVSKLASMVEAYRKLEASNNMSRHIVA